MFVNFCSSFFQRLIFGTTRNSFFFGRVLACALSFTLGFSSIRTYFLKFVTRHHLLYLFTLSGFNFKYFFIMSCCSFYLLSILNKPLFGTWVLILEDSTYGKGSSIESLEQHRNYTTLTEGVCNTKNAYEFYGQCRP